MLWKVKSDQRAIISPGFTQFLIGFAYCCQCKHVSGNISDFFFFFFFLSPTGKTSKDWRIQHNLDPSTFITHLISDVIVLTLEEHASKQDKQGLALGRLLSGY